MAITVRNKVMCFDTEYTTKASNGRKANQYDKDNHLVAVGWRKSKEDVHGIYFDDTRPRTFNAPLDDCKILVLVNAKADLPWLWRSKPLELFFKEGGEVWDCAYAEYLLTGQRWSLKRPKNQRPSMVNLYRKYRKAAEQAGDFSEDVYSDGKMDEVVAMWASGMDTTDIPKDLLMEYLLGTNAHPSMPRVDGERIKGDVAMTEYIFYRQVRRAKALGMLDMIRESMDALLATFEMEYNGLYMDKARMMDNIIRLRAKEQDLAQQLNAALPELPPNCEFNWSSGAHLSAFLFGGPITYPTQVPRTNKDGDVIYKKVTVRCPVFEKVEEVSVELKSGKVSRRVKKSKVAPFPDDCSWNEEKGLYDHAEYGWQLVDAEGAPIYKDVRVTTDEVDTKKGVAVLMLEQQVKPHHMWKTNSTVKTPLGEFPVYKTDEGVLDKLDARGDSALVKLLKKHRAVQKDLSTYFLGNLDLINEYDGCIHHTIQTHVTETSRYSCEKPNLQNVPGMNKSDFRACLTTRFGDDGVMAEPDYSQLEKVGQQVMTQDENLKQDLLRGVDFHCMNLALKEGMSYEEVVHLVKELALDEWKQKRKDIKSYTFQEAYGAGPQAMAEATGMTVDEIKALQAAAAERYYGVTAFIEECERQAIATRVPTGEFTQAGAPKGIGYYTSPMGLRFVFEERDAPKWLRERTGQLTSFYKPHIMNYPIQGSCGYFVRMALGRIFRWLVANDWFNYEVLLVNTVHDCIWFDMRKKYLQEVMPQIRTLMQDIPKYLTEVHGMTVEVPFPVEAEVGPNMGSLHHWDWERNDIRSH